MATKRPSFLKRQKEQKRAARAAEKREARAQRKQAKSGQDNDLTTSAEVTEDNQPVIP